MVASPNPEPTPDFDEIVGGFPRISVWQAAWEQAAAELKNLHAADSTPEAVGRRAWMLLLDHEKPAALDSLFYAWASSMGYLQAPAGKAGEQA
ncbi:hypothetical protein [Streptomyces sp. MJP52]|uniref:hypothetical protein n=1 Tax=Streptomyces sp. MJP52 TaxID=2940555 RepID=UPI0024746AFC|nr:hypothetical protein [Streptomyces sp. MJP52]MDH6224298.1 hypothetical protein [Streptomyces sp. MJP52]